MPAQHQRYIGATCMQVAGSAYYAEHADTVMECKHQAKSPASALADAKCSSSGAAHLRCKRAREARRSDILAKSALATLRQNAALSTCQMIHAI